MRSGTSYFDRTVFKKTVLRFWPLWGAYSIIWLMALPLSGLTALRREHYLTGDVSNYMESFAKSTVPTMASVVLPLAVVFGVLCAMAVLSHLYSARPANLFGSLPVRREGLFLTHYLAGLAFTIVPNVLVFLLTLLVELAGGCVSMEGLLFWLRAACGECFLFYSMAVFCGLFTGHILALPVFYGILNVLAAGVVGLLDLVFRAFYYGFNGFTEGVYDVVKWLTPAYRLNGAVQADVRRESILVDAANNTYSSEIVLVEAQGLGTVGIYAIAALALTVCAFFLYRARRLESAGDVVSVKVMRPVFKYGVALCAGLALGMATVAVVNGREGTLMTAIVVWGVIGYFAAQMLLDKSFRVFKKWKGAAAIAAVFIVLFCVVGFDLTGYETRVPDPARVDSVMVTGLDIIYLGDDGSIRNEETDDPDLIALFALLHRAAVEQRDLDLRELDRDTDWDLESIESTSLSLTYRLAGGGTMSRRYTLWLDPKEVDQEGTAAWAIQQIYDDRELNWKVYGFDELERRLDTPGWRLDQVQYESYSYGESYMGDPASYYYGGDAAALLAAVKEDFFAGRIGARRVDDEEHSNGRRDYERDIRFQLANSDGYQWSVTIFVQDTASSTLAVLEELAESGAGGWEEPSSPSYEHEVSAR